MWPNPMSAPTSASSSIILNALPGPQSPRGGAGRGARDDARLAPGRRRAGGRAGGDPRPRLSRARAARFRCGSTTRARTREAGPLMLFFHGGGFVLGDLDTHEPFCAEMARALDMPVLAVDYRLAPEHPWPAGIEDAIAAAYWAAESPEALGREVTGLVTCGDSAGGNFAIIVSAGAARHAGEGAGARAMADLSGRRPRPGLSELRGFRRRLSADQARDGLVRGAATRPITATGATIPLVKSQAGMPPTLVITASLDPIRDQGRAYAAACIQAGVPTIFREARGQYPRLHQPQEGDPLVRGRHQGLRRGAEAAARARRADRP